VVGEARVLVVPGAAVRNYARPAVEVLRGPSGTTGRKPSRREHVIAEDVIAQNRTHS